MQRCKSRPLTASFGASFLAAFLAIGCMPTIAAAETAEEPPARATATSDQATQIADDTLLSEAQLEQLVAPIALYPDPLLANVLIASTYPLEVVEAERWYQSNKDLKGDALTQALAKEDWDDSIKDLVTVPDALEMMNKDLDWTQDLGNAVLAQQSDVMAAVQTLRARAKENGKLVSTPQQTVTVTQTVVQNADTGSADQAAPQAAQQTQQAPPQTKEVIEIQPTDPNTVYVPYYEPSVVYGPWPYPNYQPYYFPPPPGYVFGSALATGLAWSAGFAIGNAIWGNGFSWGHDDITVNVNRNFNGNVNRNNVNVQKWEHNSAHRGGVAYNNTNVSNRFSKNQVNRNAAGDKLGGNAGNKRPTVGDIETGLKKPGGGDRPNLGAGDRPKPGDGNLAGKRPSVGDIEAGLKKPGGGDRPNIGGGDRPKAGGGDRPKAGGGDRPKASNLQANLKNKPAAAKPAAKKPQINRPNETAFRKRDGGAERKAAARGRASVGSRDISRGRVAGGGRGGGHRGGGRRR